MSTIFKKGLSSKIKSSKVSPYKARRIKKAIMRFDSTYPDTLYNSIRVSKLSSHHNLYSYKVDADVNIIFSVVDGTKVVHDIVDMKRMAKQIQNK